MKKVGLILAVLMSIIFVNSCDSDPCDEGYTQVDGICLPDYIVGIEQNFELGNEFYHSKYGTINYKNGNWYKDNGLIINNINE